MVNLSLSGLLSHRDLRRQSLVTGRQNWYYRRHNMRDLSAIAKLEKNKISSTGAWLILLEIQFQGTTIRVVNNNEDIEWPEGSGTTWVAFPFELGDIGENSKGELPSLQVKVSNVTRVIQQYL